MNYIITLTHNGYYVHLGDTPYGGPYKTEDSAKRRIRKLRADDGEIAKLAEIAATTIVHREELVEQSAVVRGNTDRGEMIIHDEPPALPDAAKLAASSAYGKTAKYSPFGTMPAGVYPAISKSERRKRWNYA